MGWPQVSLILAFVLMSRALAKRTTRAERLCTTGKVLRMGTEVRIMVSQLQRKTVGKWSRQWWRLMAGGEQELAAALGQAPESKGCVAGLDPGPTGQLTISRAIDPVGSQATR